MAAGTGCGGRLPTRRKRTHALGADLSAGVRGHGTCRHSTTIRSRRVGQLMTDTARRPRGPGMTYAVLALVILILLAVLTLSSRQPPPPTIAEFAPQSVENIT